LPCAQVAANYTTLPQFFVQNGYKTQGMGKIFHPGHASGAGVFGGCGRLIESQCQS
jgi:hypothetical protein